MTDEFMKLIDAYAVAKSNIRALSPYVSDDAVDEFFETSIAVRAAVVAALAELERDARRGCYMIEYGCWHRGAEQTHLAVLVPQGSNLSCLANRRAAIDAAILGEKND